MLIFPPSLYLQETTQRRDIAGLPVIHEINRHVTEADKQTLTPTYIHMLSDHLEIHTRKCTRITHCAL